MKQYSYHKEGNEFVLYDGDNKLCNPDKEIISTESEELAIKLVEALKKGEDYNSSQSLLCYHYTYCNLRQHDMEEFVKEFSSYMTYDAFLWDQYLMFKQGAPVKQAFAGAFSGLYSEKIKSFNKYQFVAILVLHQVYDSWMLSFRIIHDIIEKFGEDSYDSLKDSFMKELDEYERTELADMGEEIDEKRYDNYRKNLSKSIDTFIQYYTIKA